MAAPKYSKKNNHHGQGRGGDKQGHDDIAEERGQQQLGHVGKARSRAGKGNKQQEAGTDRDSEARRGNEQPKAAAEAVNGIGAQWGGKQEKGREQGHDEGKQVREGERKEGRKKSNTRYRAGPDRTHKHDREASNR